jgi:hypothetical protein
MLRQYKWIIAIAALLNCTIVAPVKAQDASSQSKSGTCSSL